MTVVEFAQKLERKEKAQLMKHGLDCEANWIQAKTHIHRGRKYDRVDVCTSGKYMIDREGNIFGIKAYGVPHLGKRFGNINSPDTIIWRNEWGVMP